MTIRTIGEHACFGGTQGFYAHESRSCGAEMRFSVYRPPQASTGRSSLKCRSTRSDWRRW